MQQNISEIEVTLKPSRHWLIFTLAGMAVAEVACLHLKYITLQVFLSLLLVAYCYYVFQRHYKLALKSSILGVRYKGGRWWIKRANHLWIPVTISEPPTVTAFLTVIPFRITKYRHLFVALFADSADVESYRRLRILLRLQKNLSRK